MEIFIIPYEFLILMGEYYLYSPTYTKYISKPIYKLSRKYLSKSKVLALHAAVLPSTLALSGLAYYESQDALLAIIFGLLHQVIITELTLHIHNNNVKERQKKIAPLENMVGW